MGYFQFSLKFGFYFVDLDLFVSVLNLTLESVMILLDSPRVCTFCVSYNS